MAPMKRQRVLADDGETEILDVENAQSTLPPVSRKRSRMSLDSPEEYSSDEVSDYDSFQEQATQFTSQQKAKSQTENAAADNGIVESITCSNFMCHGHLEITLGPLINFITGQNGSGKSAILTALAICLGGKASSTNRGQSLKNFIKEGEELAMLSVKLKNKGESAYQHETYGNYITVERHFSRSGSSAFKLRASTGRLISNKRADLEEICDYFALQIDNPMNVLTQDMARQFLNVSSPQDKYRFFMKGTQLEHLDYDYLIVEQTLDTIDTELYKKTQDYVVYCEEARKAEEKYKLCSQQDALQEKLDQLRHQMAWVQVEREEQKLAVQDSALRRLDEVIGQLQDEANGLSEAFIQTERQVENANQKLVDAKEELRPLQEHKASLKTEFDKQKSEQASLQTEHRGIVSELKEVEKRVENLGKDIDREKEHLTEAYGGKNAERRVELEERQEAVKEAKQRYDDHELQLSQLEVNERDAKKAVTEAWEQVHSKRSSVREAEDKLSALRRNRGQQLTAYPNSMPRLLSSIHQDDTFQEKPIGPIGNHVRLLKPSWSSILEKQFGATLESFIVTSKEDQNKLASLMQSCACVCPILISRKNSLDTSEYEPGPEFETWLKVLEIDNDLVRSSLIISQGIDQTILVEDRPEALSIMSRDRLRNVRQCFTHNTRSGEGIRYAYGFGGALSESFIPAFKGAPRMKTDIEYQINSQSQAVQEHKRDLSSLESLLREKKVNVAQCSNAIVNHQRVLQEKLIEIQQAQNSIEELQDALDEDAVEEGRLEALKKQLAEANEEKGMYQRTYGEAIVAKDNIFTTLRDLREEMKAVDDAIREAEARVEKLESKSTQRSNERLTRLREKNAAFAAVESAQKERSDKLDVRQEQDEIAADFFRQASEICDRVPIDDGETEESLNRKHKKLDQDLSNSRKKTGDRREIARTVERTVGVRNRAKDEIEGIETLAQLLKTTLVNRKERWKRFQRLITGRARLQFFYLLSERGARGKLSVNHKTKSLDLKVEPDETRKDGNGRTTHGLSGGEKSYSTICLLLSIWEAMGAPIRCLDEFDVFMDNVNRDISMEMMTTFARNSHGKQFVLISPGGTSKKLFGPDVKVIEMSEPERGQRTLNFTSAAA